MGRRGGGFKRVWQLWYVASCKVISNVNLLVYPLAGNSRLGGISDADGLTPTLSKNLKLNLNFFFKVCSSEMWVQVQELWISGKSGKSRKSYGAINLAKYWSKRMARLKPNSIYEFCQKKKKKIINNPYREPQSFPQCPLRSRQSQNLGMQGLKMFAARPTKTF